MNKQNIPKNPTRETKKSTLFFKWLIHKYNKKNSALDNIIKL